MKLIFLSLTLLALSLSSSQDNLMALLVIFTFGLILLNFTSYWNHVFLMLLNLELMGLSFILFLGLISSLVILNMELFFIFFTFAVCEASIGIAVLIFFSHAKGSETMDTLF